MKSQLTSLSKWLLDSLAIVVIAGCGILLLPVVTGWLSGISLRVGRTMFWLHFIILSEFLPHVIVGSFQGFIAGWVIQHRRLTLLVAPALLCAVFYLLFISFGSVPYTYSWGRSWWDFIVVSNSLVLVVSAALSGFFMLRCRRC